MATWQEVRTYVHSNYKVEDIDPAMMKMLFDSGNGRSQIIFVGHFDLSEAGMGDWLTYFSPFCGTDQATANAVMGVASDNTMFGITEMAGMYGVRHVAPMLNLDANEIEDPLMAVVFSADNLEKLLTGGDAF